MNLKKIQILMNNDIEKRIKALEVTLAEKQKSTEKLLFEMEKICKEIVSLQNKNAEQNNGK